MMKRICIITTGFCTALACAAAAHAAEKIRLRPGMSASEVQAALAGRCKDNYVGPPNVTCTNGNAHLTATSTKKGRIHWMRYLDPAKDNPHDYAKALAAELGFSGELMPCESNGKPAFCITDQATGNALMAASTEYEEWLTSYLSNDLILKEDGGQQ